MEGRFMGDLILREKRLRPHIGDRKESPPQKILVNPRKTGGHLRGFDEAGKENEGAIRIVEITSPKSKGDIR